MTRRDKLLRRILSGRSDADIAFADLATLLEALGFKRRVKGSHNLFTKQGVRERINLQAEGSKAKRYQVKQVRDILTKYGLGENDGE